MLIQETIKAQSCRHRHGLRRDVHERRASSSRCSRRSSKAQGVVSARSPTRSAIGVTRVEHIMGMPIVVDVRDVDDAAALEPLFDWFRLVDATFSTYKDDSEISRLNRGELALADAHRRRP